MMAVDVRRRALILSTTAAIASCASGGEGVVVRLDYQRSCQRLRELGLLGAGEYPPLPGRQPRYDDEEPLGVSLLRFAVEDGDLSRVTLPRTFAARSSFERVVFDESDFSESTLCWNDFVDCSFVGAQLVAADLRASIFERAKFNGANLFRADLRRSSFEGCTFEGANLSGAVFTPRQRASLELSQAQRSQVAWTDEDGPEPDGG